MGKKATHDIAPNIRAWSAAGIRKLAQRKGQTPAELFADWFEADPAGMLRAVARYNPRESVHSGTVKHDHRHTNEPVSTTSQWIEGMLGDAEEGEIAEPVPSGSLLSAPVRTAETGY